MRISLKSGSSENKEIEIEDSSTVLTLRQQVAEKYSTTPNLVVLIFAGKIIKDASTLTECKIADGLSLHVVLKKASGSAASTPATASTPSTAPAARTPSTPAAATTTPAAAAAAAPSPADFFGTGMSGMNMEQAQQQMMNNPEMMEQMLNNPLVNSVMSDPNVMQELMNSNPQLRGMMDQHPEIRSMMSNPDMMRQAMEMARNPQAMQEMMRGNDRAMQNIESMPGGYNALRRMHEDVVQPMQDAMSPNNPFEQLNSNNSNNENAASNTETTSALPNPWGNSSDNSANRAAGAARPQMTEGLQNAMMNAMMNNNPAMANIPEAARSQMGRMFSDPETMAAMQRPAVREAMAQIQQGYETINREAPGLARAMGMPEGMGGMAGMSGMSGMSGGAAPSRPAPAADTRTPEVRFATQITQLEDMGFTNKQNNIAALVATNGNLNQAVDRLVGMM